MAQCAESNGQLYKCQKCGSVGCTDNQCSKKNFDNSSPGRCLTCGNSFPMKVEIR